MLHNFFRHYIYFYLYLLILYVYINQKVNQQFLIETVTIMLTVHAYLLDIEPERG